MKSFTDNPDPGSHFQSNVNFSLSPIWNMLCMSFSLSAPFSTFVFTPRRLKLLITSVWI